MAKKKFVVQCPIHGIAGTNQFRWEGKMVVVPEPKSKKRAKTSGCPICKADAKIGD